MSTKKVLLGIAAVAVVAIGYFAVTGFPPVGPGTEGTVGAAKRYQSEQMATKDVVLRGQGRTELPPERDVRPADQEPGRAQGARERPDPRRPGEPRAGGRARQPRAPAALQSAELRAALANPAMRAALASPELAAALASPR